MEDNSTDTVMTVEANSTDTVAIVEANSTKPKGKVEHIAGSFYRAENKHGEVYVGPEDKAKLFAKGKFYPTMKKAEFAPNQSENT